MNKKQSSHIPMPKDRIISLMINWGIFTKLYISIYRRLEWKKMDKFSFDYALFLINDYWSQ